LFDLGKPDTDDEDNHSDATGNAPLPNSSSQRMTGTLALIDPFPLEGDDVSEDNHVRYMFAPVLHNLTDFWHKVTVRKCQNRDDVYSVGRDSQTTANPNGYASYGALMTKESATVQRPRIGISDAQLRSLAKK
jgi:hypothetical protein